MFNTLANTCPDYFINHVMRRISPYSTRFPNFIYVNNIAISLNSYASNLSSVTSCRVWNNLPCELTDCTSVNVFKSNLKNYLLTNQ